MLVKIQSLIFLLLVSCATTETKTPESSWTSLAKAEPISCSPWPLKESELDISQLMASSVSGGSFLATMRLRNGSQVPVYARSSTDIELDLDDMISLPIGRQAHVLGVSEWKNEAVAFVSQNRSDRAWIEVRAVKDNRLISRMATPISGDVYSGKVSPTRDGWWLQLNHGEADASFVSVVPHMSKDWKFSLAANRTKTRFATIVSSKTSKDAFIFEMVPSTDEGVSNFKVTRMEVAGKSSDLGLVPLPTRGGTESWSAQALGDRLALAVVRGDSMVGQASLIIAVVSASTAGIGIDWKQEYPYEDVHLGEPVWLVDGGRAMLGLMKWMDAEGTLSRFRVDAYKVDTLGDVGVFESGSVLVAGYLKGADEGIGAFRLRDKDLWKYKICKLKL